MQRNEQFGGLFTSQRARGKLVDNPHSMHTASYILEGLYNYFSHFCYVLCVINVYNIDVDVLTPKTVCIFIIKGRNGQYIKCGLVTAIMKI